MTPATRRERQLDQEVRTYLNRLQEAHVALGQIAHLAGTADLDDARDALDEIERLATAAAPGGGR